MPETTPPNWPIYNITLSHSEITQLLTRTFPKAHLISSQQLPTGKSYNNRIYFLTIQFNREDQQQEPQEVVLKVIGRFFDARKVQNEVASLLLLSRYCPEIPVPRVLAWSDDGLQITAIQNGVFAVLSNPIIDEVPQSQSTNPHPWIMMSKCPGRLLANTDLSGPYSNSIANQLSDIIKSWRENIPPRQEIGNIKLQPAGFTSTHALHGLDTIITNSLLLETTPQYPLTTLQQYYDHVLADQIHKLKIHQEFSLLRPQILEQLQHFRTDVLPYLPCFTEQTLSIPNSTAIVFTHQDLSPRNILISDPEQDLNPTTITPSAPTITGIIDFEFSGFFSPEEEYLTSLGRQSDDWPPPFMHLLLKKLDSKNVPIPIKDTNIETNTPTNKQSKPFNTLLQLIKLIEHAAPWWLEDDSRQVKINRAREVIEYNMAKLIESVRHGNANDNGS